MAAKPVLWKTLGLMLLLMTAGLASCQSFWFSWDAEVGTDAVVPVPGYGQPIRRN